MRSRAYACPYLSHIPLYLSLAVPLYTYEQLMRMGKGAISAVAMKLRDAIGAEHVPTLMLQQQQEGVARWILERQTELARATSIKVDLENYGFPDVNGPIGATRLHPWKNEGDD